MSELGGDWAIHRIQMDVTDFVDKAECPISQDYAKWETCFFRATKKKMKLPKNSIQFFLRQPLLNALKVSLTTKKIARLNDLRLPRISWAHSMQAFTPFLKIKRNFGFCLFTLGILIYLAVSVLNKFYLQFLQTVNYDNTFYTRTLGFNHHINDNNT